MHRFGTSAVFLPTNRDKSPVWVLSGEVGYVPDLFVRAILGETGLVRVSRCSRHQPLA